MYSLLQNWPDVIPTLCNWLSNHEVFKLKDTIKIVALLVSDKDAFEISVIKLAKVKALSSGSFSTGNE